MNQSLRLGFTEGTPEETPIRSGLLKASESLKGAGGFTGIGAALAPMTGGASLAVGGALDIGKIIADYFAAKEADEEAKRQQALKERLLLGQEARSASDQNIKIQEYQRKLAAKERFGAAINKSLAR